jgi:hypothetical protein
MPTTFVQKVSPYEPSETFWARNKAMARNRMRGDWLAPSTGDVSMVEVVSVTEGGDGSATIVYGLTE